MILVSYAMTKIDDIEWGDYVILETGEIVTVVDVTLSKMVITQFGQSEYVITFRWDDGTETQDYFGQNDELKLVIGY